MGCLLKLGFNQIRVFLNDLRTTRFSDALANVMYVRYVIHIAIVEQVVKRPSKRTSKQQFPTHFLIQIVPWRYERSTAKAGRINTNVDHPFRLFVRLLVLRELDDSVSTKIGVRPSVPPVTTRPNSSFSARVQWRLGSLKYCSTRSTERRTRLIIF